MLGSFWVIQRGDDLYLQLPADRLPGILKQFANVRAACAGHWRDASGELARFGITGSCAADLLPFAPGADKATATRDDITVIRLPGERPRFEIIGPVSALAPL